MVSDVPLGSLPVVEDVFQRRARSFGGVADVYQRARPTYPMAAVRWMTDHAPGRQALDLAAGTGKLTAVLVEAGFEVTAVEPAPEMLAQLRAALPAVTPLAGSAEAIPLADASCDAVLVAQAFHWFEPGRALDEIARVLRPGGPLGLCWNLRDDSVDWVATLSGLLGSPGDVVSAAPPLREEPAAAHESFRDTERRAFPNPQPFTVQRLVEWANSGSWVAVLEASERERVLDSVRELCATHPALRGRETFDLPFVTECVRSVRRVSS
jgi:SAM-dependent methyltransferase